MKNNNQKILNNTTLSKITGGKNKYGGSGNRWVHCGAGIVGGALIGAIGGPYSTVAGALTGGLNSCH